MFVYYVSLNRVNGILIHLKVSQKILKFQKGSWAVRCSYFAINISMQILYEQEELLVLNKNELNLFPPLLSLLN